MNIKVYVDIKDSLESLVEELRKQQYQKIYLSHEPWQELEAREFASKLADLGFKVQVAADVRPHKWNPQSKNDLEIVAKAIDESDVMVVYGEATKKLKNKRSETK